MPFGDQVLRVKMLVKETTDPAQINPLYTVAAVEIGKPASSRGESIPSEEGRSPAPPAGFDARFAQMVAAVKGDGVSKVVDPATGEPLVVYHGTTADIDEFSYNKDAPVYDVGIGYFYAGRSSEASYFAEEPAGLMGGTTGKFAPRANLVAAYLAISNPKIYATQTEYKEAVDNAPYSRDGNGAAHRAELEKEGYDGVIILDSEFDDKSKEGGAWYIAARPEQIKSAIGNVGTFDENTPDISYRMGTRQTGLPAAHVRQIAERIAMQWQNAPRMVVLDSMEDPRTPQAARDAYLAQQRGGASGVPVAFIHRGTVYLVANALHDARAVVSAVAHEALGHYGLRGFFGKELATVLDRLVTLRRKDVADMARRYGLDMDDPVDRLRAAEEVLARMAETQPQLGFVRNAVAAIRSFLRGLGLNLRYTDDEIIRDFILPARRFVERGKIETVRDRQTATAMQRAPEVVELGFEPPGGKRFARVSRDETGARYDYYFTRQDAESASENRARDAANEAFAASVPDHSRTAGDGHPNRSEEAARLELARARRQSAFSTVMSVRRAARAGELVHDPARAGRCFELASLASSAGLGNMVIGRAWMTHGGRDWHAAVRDADGYVYDPTDRHWYSPGVYESAYGFMPVRELTPETVRTFLRVNDGMVPDPRSLGFEHEPVDFSRAATFSRGRREVGYPKEAGAPIATFESAEALKRHPDYRAAKAGDMAAAARLVRDLVRPEQLQAAQQRFGRDAIYVPAHGMEDSGHNAIPEALAHYYAAHTGSRVEDQIVQANQAHHTGADAMERLIARPLFDGPVEHNGQYVLVDDVSTMGSTLSELADHIRAGGGKVIGSVLLANASRSGTLPAPKLHTALIERRFGDEVRKQFNVEPGALTHDEARYLAGFKDAEQLRNRAAQARVETQKRLLAKGVRPGVEGAAEKGAGDVASSQGEVKPSDIAFSLSSPRAPAVLHELRDHVADLFDSQKTFGWWHKTVGTQYHKAKVDPDFGRVYEAGQNFLHDVSRFANSAADLAPELLPRLGSIADVRRNVLRAASARDLEAVAKPIYTGTLEDNRVYTDAELNKRFGLNTKQIRYYRQFRAAVDKSLDDFALSQMARLARGFGVDAAVKQATDGMTLEEGAAR